MLVVALPLDLTCRTLFLNSGSATKKCILLPFSRTPKVIATSFSREQKVGGRHQVTVALPQYKLHPLHEKRKWEGDIK